MNKKLTAIFATMLIALCLAGVSYAMWDKTLYINGTVNTGDVNAIWTSAANLDPPAPPISLDLNPDFTRKDKDVGSTTVTGVGTQTLTVTINNGYPSYFNDIEIEWKYTGSIPAYFVSITIIPNGFTLATSYGANDGPIWVHVVDGYPIQVHQGDTGAHSFKIHVEQCAAELATYTFTVKLLFVQWNEYP